MAQSPLRIGIIGAGGIFRDRHLPNLQQRDDVTLVAVSNRSEASSRDVADAFGFAEIETDWQQLINRSDLDIVMIGTWPYMHCEMTCAALEAGKHVFCQARMAMDLPEAQAMLDAAEAAPRQVAMICPPPHRMPWEPYIRQTLSEGRLGELLSIRVESVDAANLGPITWREQVEYSGQQVLQMGIIAETLNAWLGEYESLVATTATPVTRKSDSEGRVIEIGIPQVVTIAGRLTTGTPIVEHHCGVANHNPVNAVTIFGSEATLRVDFMKQISFGKPGHALEPIDVPDDMQNPWRVEADFIEAVRAAETEKPFHVSPDFHEGLRYMRKIAAVHASAQSGQRVTLTEVQA